MLKYEKIIRILSVEEKVELLTSNEAYRNRKVENYMLPEFNITTKSYQNNANECYPSFQSIGSTWNVELLEKLGHKVGKFNIAHTNGKIAGVPANKKDVYASESFSSEGYAAGKMAAAMLKGLNSSEALGCVFNLPQSTSDVKSEVREELLPYEIAIKEGKPYAVYSNGIDHLEFVNEINYINLLAVECSEATEVIKALQNNCDLGIIENAKEIILEAIERYKAAKIDLYYKRITRVEFDELQRNGIILNPDIIDKKLDVLLEKISLFDEKMIVANAVEDSESLDYQIASESLIMLKNNGILPLQPSTGAYIVGEAIEAQRTNGNVSVDSLLSVFEESDLTILGSAHGYSSDFIKNTRLIDKAVKLSDEFDAEAYIVFLYAPENSFKLPDEQLELIEKLNNKGKKIIAILQTENLLDYSFVNKCSAVIQTGLFGGKTITALCDMLVGSLNPSGKTIAYCPKSLDAVINKFDKNTYLYPVGFGLTYSDFEYSHLRVTQQGISFVIKNTSHVDGVEVPQMYIEFYDDKHVPVYRHLRGFKKVHIKALESVKVFIPFDEYTFRTFNNEADCYEIKAGRYGVLVGSSGDNVKLLAEISLDGKLFDINGFKNEDITGTNDGETLKSFLKFNDRKEGKAIANGPSLTKKILISSVIAVYYNIIMIPLLISVLEDSNIILAIIIGVMVAVANIIYAIFLVKSIKNRRPREINIINDTASIMLDRLGNYSEIAKVTYPKPISPVPEGIEVDEEGNEIEKIDFDSDEFKTYDEEFETDEVGFGDEEFEISDEEVEPAIEYDLGVDEEYLCTNIEYDNNLEIEQWVKQFVDYASTRGLIIEHKSARALLASITSSRLVIIRSVSSELLPLVQQILFEFVDSKYEPVSFDNVYQYSDLIWTLEDGRYVCSNLVNSLYRAKALKNHINLCALERVDFTTFERKFDKLFSYLSSRAEDVKINLGQENEVLEFVVPKNMVFIATADTEDYLESLPKNVANCSLSIELALRTNEIFDPEAYVPFGFMSNNHLEELMKRAKEVNYIFEKQWKKFDDLEEQVNELSPFSIHNKTVLCFENLAAFILSCGVEIDEFLDLALSSRIAPELKSLKAYTNTNGDANLLGIIIKIFGEDLVSQTKRTLKKPL